MEKRVIATIALLTIVAYTTEVKSSPLSRIVNGEIAHMHQFPWHVSLHVTTSTATFLRYGGGSLISPVFVLTAASNLRDAQSIRIDMGSIRFLEPLETQESTVFTSHNQYDPQTNNNNIGVIRLPNSVSYSNTLRAVLLPGRSHASDLYIDIPADISGFGVTVNGGNVLSEYLRFAHKVVISNEECQRDFDSRFVPVSAMCAIGYGNTRQTACFGDIGGAFVTQYHDTWMQIGIASHLHPSGCSGGFPVVYTRMTSYIEWINQMTGISIDH